MFNFKNNRLEKLVLPFLLLFCLTLKAQQQEPLTRILFVFDASNSMNAPWQSKPKINIARELLSQSLEQLRGTPNLELGLRVYGHQTHIRPGEQDCDDTKLEVEFRKSNATVIQNKLSGIVPKGTTPIARSLEKAAGDFPDCDNCRNIIILITDGIEACDEDPCAVSRALQEKGVVLKPFVIGIGMGKDYMETFECVGNYYDVSKEENFKNVLDIVITQALNNTTAQVNLLNINGRPTETNVPVTFYDKHSGKIAYNFVHTLNHRGNPDTLVIDPVFTYRVVAHTIPPVQNDSATLLPGIHNIIPVDAAQGSLKLKTEGTRNDFKDLKCIVRKKNEMKTTHVQDFNTTERYIVGDYDLEILTLPRTYIEEVNIAQSHTTTITIPQPGVVNVLFSSPGYGSILQEKNNELVWVCNVDPTLTKDQFVLQPGKYRLVYRSKNSKETIYTIEKNFKITSGTSVNLRF